MNIRTPIYCQRGPHPKNITTNFVAISFISFFFALWLRYLSISQKTFDKYGIFWTFSAIWKISQPKSKKPKILVALMANIRTSNISMLKKANIVEHLNPNIRRLVAPDMDKINKGKIISCTRTFSSSTEILLTFSYPETESLHFGFSAPKKLTIWYFGQSYQKLTFWYPSRILKRKTYIFVGNRKLDLEWFDSSVTLIIFVKVHYSWLFMIDWFSESPTNVRFGNCDERSRKWDH